MGFNWAVEPLLSDETIQVLLTRQDHGGPIFTFVPTNASKLAFKQTQVEYGTEFDNVT